LRFAASATAKAITLEILRLSFILGPVGGHAVADSVHVHRNGTFEYKSY
jgi:hypothetical protein